MKKTIISFVMCVAALTGFTACCGENSDNMENEVTKTIMARRSIRQYTDEKVPRDVLEKLAVLGVNAPNAMNRQDWAVRIVDSEEYLDGVTAIMKARMPFMVKDDDPTFRNGFRNATAVIFVAIPEKDEIGMMAINAGLLCENICLAAESFGLGTCVMAAPTMMMSTNPEAKPFIDRLDLPEGYRLAICVGVGYPAEAPDAKPRDLTKIRFID